MLRNFLQNKTYLPSLLSKVIVGLIIFLPLSSMFSHFFVIGSIDNNTVSLISLYHLTIYILLGTRLLFPPKLPKIPFLLILLNILYLSINILINPTSIEYLYSNYLKIIMLLFAILAIYKITSDTNIENFLTLSQISTTILIIAHFSALYFLKDSNFGHLGNYIGYLPSKHATAAVFWSAFPFVFYYFQKKKSMFNLILLFLVIFFLFFSYQRTAILSLILLLSFYVILRKKLSSILTVGILSMISVFILYFISLSQYWNIWIQPEISAMNNGDIYALGKGRIGFYIEGLKMFFYDFDFIQKIFGIGFGKNYLVHLIVTGFKSHAHIQFIAILIDNGIIGVILLMMFYLSLISNINIKDIRKKKDETILGFVILLISGISIFYSMSLVFGSLTLCFLLWIGYFLNISATKRINEKN